MRIIALVLLCLSLVLGGCSKSSDSSAAKTSKTAKKKKKKSKKGKAGKKGKSSYAAVDTVADGGTISGTISFAGDTKDGTVNFTKDQETCKNADGTNTIPEGAIAVVDGKLKNAVVALEGVKTGKKFDAEKITVDNIGCVFMPRISVGKKGGILAAKNSDPILHNTHLYLKAGNKNIFNIALPNKDQVIEKPLRKSGLVDVKCDAHEWMQAYIYVSEHPYVAISDASGAFSMSDVPAGEYSGKVWHEKLGEKDFKVKVEAGGTANVNVAF